MVRLQQGTSIRSLQGCKIAHRLTFSVIPCRFVVLDRSLENNSFKTMPLRRFSSEIHFLRSNGTILVQIILDYRVFDDLNDSLSQPQNVGDQKSPFHIFHREVRLCQFSGKSAF